MFFQLYVSGHVLLCVCPLEVIPIAAQNARNVSITSHIIVKNEKPLLISKLQEFGLII